VNKNTSFDEQIFNFSTLATRVLKIVVAADRYQTATRPFAPANPCKISLFSPRQNPVFGKSLPNRYPPRPQALARRAFSAPLRGCDIHRIERFCVDSAEFFLFSIVSATILEFANFGGNHGKEGETAGVRLQGDGNL